MVVLGLLADENNCNGCVFFTYELVKGVADNYKALLGVFI